MMAAMYDQRTLTGFAPSFAAPMQHPAQMPTSYAPRPPRRPPRRPRRPRSRAAFLNALQRKQREEGEAGRTVAGSRRRRRDYRG